MKNQRILRNSLAILVPLLLVVILYGQIFFNPSDYMFSNDGDGVKNYYALAWFVEHNDGWIDHSGMNYPYGEHYIYTDGFVPLGWILKTIGVDGAQSIGIANILMLLSFVFGAFFLFKILRYYKVSFLIALLASSAITILTPQVYRMGGHFSLSLMLFFPLTFWMFIRYIQTMSSWIWTFIIALNVIFWLLMHPYLGVILILFLLCVWFMILLKDRKILSNGVVMFQMLMQTVMPLLAFKIFTSITDIHHARPDKPTGFWEHGASLKSIFLANDGPMSFAAKYFDMSKVSWESQAYIGLGAMLFIVFYLFQAIINRKNRVKIYEPKQHFEFFLIPSILVLIFSFGIPFYQLPVLADILSPVRNFRALGRFAWPFYYIITLFSVIKLFQWSSVNREKTTYYKMALFLLIGLMFVEGTGRHMDFAKRILTQKNTFKTSLLSQEMKNVIEHAKMNSYLSILPIPYYHVGSERYTVSSVEDGLYNSMLISYHTGIPILSNQLPRTSLGETKKSIMTVSPVYYERKICEDITSGDLLIVRSKGKLKRAEERYLLNSQSIFEGIVSLRKIQMQEICRVESSITINDSLLRHKGNLYYSINSDDYLEYFNLKGEESDGRIFEENFIVLKDFGDNEIGKGKYEVTIWYKNPGDNLPNDAFFVETKSKDGSGGAWESFETLDKSTMFSGDSLIFTKEIVITDLSKTHKIIIKKSKYDSPNLSYMNMLIRKSDQDVYIMNGDSVSINNHRMILLE